MTTRIIISVEGGVVQGVVSNNPNVVVYVHDWDNVKQMDTIEENNFLLGEPAQILFEKEFEEQVNKNYNDANEIINQNNK